jgi:CRISPR-associated protein Cmr2
MSNDPLWQAKLAARIHDPAEKALVLLRDPAGHEGGTSAALKRLLGLDQLPQFIDTDNAEALSTVMFKKGLPLDIYRHVQRADWWAAAADRPQWPMQDITVTTRQGEQKTLKVADWAQVRWTKKPVLIHPLTGDQYDLGQHGGLGDTDFQEIKQKSFEHFSGLLKALGAQDGAPGDLRKTLLTYWRFGPELAEEEDNGKLGALWGLLPADTRIPDHSIWDHLDLTSAFAGAFAADPDGEAALLALHRPGAGLHRGGAQHLRSVGWFPPAVPSELGGHAPGLRGAGAGCHPVSPAARHSPGRSVATRPDGPAR